ncbi:MAG: hypothetical protein HYZ54_02370 [Ignavibacteriae bacterium]|nr:hypothetical protein [Ignavibacteriota bacterium]
MEVESADLSSTHNLAIVYNNGAFSHPEALQFTAILQSVPKALWKTGDHDLSTDTLIKNVLTGFKISEKDIQPDVTPFVDLALLLGKIYNYTPTLSWSTPNIISGPTPPADPFAVLEQTVLAPADRPSILQSLVANGFDIDVNVNVTKLSQRAADFYLAPPVFEYGYWKK